MEFATSRWRARLALTIPFCLPFLLLMPFRAGGFVADDFYFARTPFSIALSELAANREWRHEIAPDVQGYRPLATASYALNQRLGDGSPTGFRLTNFTLHGASSSLVAALTMTLAGSTMAGLAAGALFAVHPMHHENVLWISGRTFPLAALFYLSALLVAVRTGASASGAREGKRATPVTGDLPLDDPPPADPPSATVWGRPMLLATSAAALTACALASYEGAVTLPLAVFALALAIGERRDGKPPANHQQRAAVGDTRNGVKLQGTGHEDGQRSCARKSAADWRAQTAHAASLVLPHALVTITYLVLRWLLISSPVSEASAFGSERLLHNGLAVVGRLLAIPRLGHTPIVASATFWVSAAVAALAIGAGLRSLATRRRVAWILAFAGLSYLSFIALPGYSDRFAYMTSAGFVIALVVGWRAHVPSGGLGRFLAALPLCLVLALWSAQLVRAGGQWMEAGALAESVAAQLRRELPEPPVGARLGFLCVPDFHGTAYVYYTYFEAEMVRTLRRPDVAITKFPRGTIEGTATVDYLFRWLDRERRLELVRRPGEAPIGDASEALACQPEPLLIKP